MLDCGMKTELTVRIQSILMELAEKTELTLGGAKTGHRNVSFYRTTALVTSLQQQRHRDL